MEERARQLGAPVVGNLLLRSSALPYSTNVMLVFPDEIFSCAGLNYGATGLGSYKADISTPIAGIIPGIGTEIALCTG